MWRFNAVLHGFQNLPDWAIYLILLFMVLGFTWGTVVTTRDLVRWIKWRVWGYGEKASVDWVMVVCMFIVVLAVAEISRRVVSVALTGSY